jgi:hypothetical protein
MRSICVLAVLPAFLFAAISVEAGVVISEFQAANADTIRDEDGDRSDWIELHNDGVGVENVAGLALTDDPAVPRKWVLPARTIAPGGYLLVWASGKDRAAAAGALHTNFRLAAAGGYLALQPALPGAALTEFAAYPAQPDDRSWGTAAPLETTRPMVAGAACRLLVPTGVVSGWQAPGFDDGGWRAAFTGIGYDRTLTPTDYNGLIGAGGNVETLMFGLRPSCYVRVPFAVSDPSGVMSLKLRMQWEDGVAVWLNGVRVNPPTPASTNSPADPAFNSVSTAVRADTSAVIFQEFDISGQANLLMAGVNVLALQALNQSSSSSDLLLVPEIELTRQVAVGLAPVGYMAVATPGAPNRPPVVAGFTDAPDFSVKRGLFTDPVTVALTTNTPGAVIRYTVDASPPVATSPVYSNPLVIGATTVLRAAAFREGWATSVAKTHTYIFPVQVAGQPAAPAGFPATWGNQYDYTAGTLTGPVVPADYRMDPAVTGNPAYTSLMVPALAGSLPVVSLAAKSDELFAFDTGIYANGRMLPTEIGASVEYFNPLDPTGTEKFQEDIGLRMHGGNAPIDHPKKPFRLYFRKAYGVDRLRYPLFPGSKVEEFDKLQLRPGGHDGWAVPFGSADNDLAPHATYLRDRFLRQTELDMGRLSYRGRYVHLYINGLYWGVYDLHEVISSEFFASHKGGAEADWDVYEHSNTSNPLFDVVEGTSAAMDAALALVRPATNAASPAVYAAIERYVPLDEFIDNMLVQMWGGQNDWMGPVFRGIPGAGMTDASRFFNKNWESGRRSRGLLPEDGLYWQVWDAEISMGSSLTSLVTAMRVTDFNHTLVGTPATEIARVAGTPGPPAELWYALRKNNGDFRRRVSDRIQRRFFNGGVMSVPAMQARLQMLRDQLDLPIVAEGARWGDVNSGNPVVVTMTRDTHWRPEVDWMRDTYVPGRQATLLNQFAAIGMWSAVQAPVLAQSGGSVPSGYSLAISNPNGGGVVYYTLDGSDPAQAGAGVALVNLTPSGGVRFKVPTANYSGNSWKNLAEPADIGTWGTGTAALGFADNGIFNAHFTTLVTGMAGVNPSLYVRMPFTVTAEQKAAMTRLTLNLKYDDGAFVFLNGSTPLFRLNAPATTPAFNSAATAARADAESVVAQAVDLTNQIGVLSTTSANLIGLQGMNESAANGNFLLAAELVAEIRQPERPSGGAVAYGGPVSLGTSGMVKARVLQNGTWSPLSEAFFIVGVPASAGKLVISEMNYNPLPTAAETAAGVVSSQLEFIELMNISGDAVELGGCRFGAGITFDFGLNSVVQRLEAGQRMLIVSDAAAFGVRYPGVPVAGVFQAGTNLSNGGERLALLAADGSAVLDFSYGDSSPWPKAADGQGYSLVLIRPETNPGHGVAANWRASAGLNGTPGGSDGESFAAWAARTGQPADPALDEDRNGLAAMVEYGLGLTPSAGGAAGVVSARLEPVSVNGVTDSYLVMRVRWSRVADDVVVVPEFSTALTGWQALVQETEARRVLPGGMEEATYRTPVPEALLPRAQVRVSVRARP